MSLLPARTLSGCKRMIYPHLLGRTGLRVLRLHIASAGLGWVALPPRPEAFRGFSLTDSIFFSKVLYSCIVCCTDVFFFPAADAPWRTVYCFLFIFGVRRKRSPALPWGNPPGWVDWGPAVCLCSSCIRTPCKNKRKTMYK
jgi:hypothetical protein